MHDQSFLSVVGSVAAVVVPVTALLWFLIKTEMKNQILTLKEALGLRVGEVETRVAVLESQDLTVREMKNIASMVHRRGQGAA